MNRKTIITVIAVILLLAAGGAVWYLFVSSPKLPGEKRSFFGNLPIIGGRGAPAPETPSAPPGGETGIDIGREARPLIQIIDQDVLAPTLSSDSKSLYYLLRENGHIMKADLDGANEQTLTNLTILETFDGAWSPTKTKIALSYHESGAVKRFLLETATATPSKFLPPDITSLDWSPDGKEIAYLVPKNSQSSIVIADQNGKNGRVVFSTPIPDFTLQWISKNIILLVSRPSGLAPSLVMSFDAKTRRADVALSGGYGVVIAPAPDGSGFLFSQSTSGGGAKPVAVYTFKDGGVNQLNQTTMAEKCAFSPEAKKLYCGVPKGKIPQPSPDEWYKGAASFSDAIVEIDLATGQNKTLMEDEADVDVISPFVSPDGKYLFSQNKKDGTLWRLTVGQ